VTAKEAGTVSRRRRRRSTAAPIEPRLAIVHPPELAGDHVVPAGAIVIGRNPERGLELAHATVSRRHAILEWDAVARCHRAHDLGSRNGTWIDGEPATQLRRVGDNAVVRIGDVVGVYRADPAGPARAAGLEVSRVAVPGRSTAIAAVRAAIARIAPDPAPVLVSGATGTGKERIAGELHRLSGRAGPLVAINCAAISPQLVESHLFGHERGAFSGATTAQPGAFRAADGGSVFLDEIGELPLEHQAALLRAIQEGEVHPVGAARPIRVDVRVIAATNRDLGAAVAAGGFRRDLHARLAIWELRVPPLCARRADLVEWLAILHAAWNARRGGAIPAPRFDADAIERVLLASWPDNLRGLDRLLHEVAGADDELARDELPAWLEVPPPIAVNAPADRPPAPDRPALLAALAQYGYSVRAVARHYARDRRQIYRWMQALGIELRATSGTR
jgi:transcriptional regulator with GAF, ATPase, and Fis domain